MNSDGPLIGLVPSQYASKTVHVQRGDRLLVYTDGVLEAANQSGAFFGDERFHLVIAQNATKSSAELGRAIVDEMRHWCQNAAGFADDVTLAVIEVQ